MLEVLSIGVFEYLSGIEPASVACKMLSFLLRRLCSCIASPPTAMPAAKTTSRVSATLTAVPSLIVVWRPIPLAPPTPCYAIASRW
jgi:hypothetical protein